MEPLEVFEKFGLPISFLIIMIWLYIKNIEQHQEDKKDHRQERGEWRSSQERLQTDTNSALRELAQLISKIEKK